MESPMSTTVTSTHAIGGSSGRGRPRLTDDAASKRAQQLREAQRSHREKKAQHLKDLEDQLKAQREIIESFAATRDKVAQLEFELALWKERAKGCRCESLLTTNSTATVTAIPTASSKNGLLLGNSSFVADMSATLPFATSAATVDNSSLSPFALPPPSSSLSSPQSDVVMQELDFLLGGFVPRMLSSEEIYGPMEVETIRIWIKALPSIKDKSKVDQMVDLIVEHSRATDWETAKKQIIKLVQHTSSLIFEISPQDRVKLVELMAISHERNLNHFRYIAQFWGAMLPPAPPFTLDPAKPSHRSIIAVKQKLLQIPSLSLNESVVDEFCANFASAMETKDTAQVFRIHICLAKFTLLCNIADRTRFMGLFMELKTSKQCEMKWLTDKSVVGVSV